MQDPPETPLKRLLFLPSSAPPVPLVRPCCLKRAWSVRGMSRVPFWMRPGNVRKETYARKRDWSVHGEAGALRFRSVSEALLMRESRCGSVVSTYYLPGQRLLPVRPALLHCPAFIVWVTPVPRSAVLPYSAFTVCAAGGSAQR